MRGFTQDDAHIFCLPEQIAGEIVGVLALVEEVMGAFGFQEFEVRRATLDMCAAVSASYKQEAGAGRGIHGRLWFSGVRGAPRHPGHVRSY